MAKKQKMLRWFVIGLIAALIAVPNATIIRASTGTTDPYVYNLIRMAIMAVSFTPFLFAGLRQYQRQNLKYALIVGLSIAVCFAAFVEAIHESQASYVGIVALLTPIVLVVYSARFAKEKISHRAVAGITIAALGALLAVGLPLAIRQQGNFTFYPAATLWAIVNCLTAPLITVYSKKANDNGMHLTTFYALAFWLALAFGVVGLIMFNIPFEVEAISSGSWLGIAYSAVVANSISFIMMTKSYEHIGSAAIGGITYIETIAAIVLPLLILREKLSPELVLGGGLILFGVFLVEHHKSGYIRFSHSLHNRH